MFRSTWQERKNVFYKPHFSWILFFTNSIWIASCFSWRRGGKISPPSPALAQPCYFHMQKTCASVRLKPVFHVFLNGINPIPIQFLPVFHFTGSFGIIKILHSHARPTVMLTETWRIVIGRYEAIQKNAAHDAASPVYTLSFSPVWCFLQGLLMTIRQIAVDMTVVLENKGSLPSLLS